jgi:dipeptidyl-peptidase-4
MLAACMTLAAVAVLGQREPLSVERIASQPTLSGTPPVSPIWSPDSTRLAFLWNDGGWAFRDIWIVEAAGGTPKRVTDMVRAIQPPAGTGVNASEAADRARRSGGISEVVWSPDGRRLVFACQGDLFRINPDGTALERLTTARGARREIRFSPDGRYLAFLQEGDLWLWDQRAAEPIRATQVAVPAISTGPGTYHRPDVEIGSYVWGGGPAYAWSADGRFIGFHYEDRRQMRKVPFPNYLTEETTVDWRRRGYPGDFDEIRKLGIYDVAAGGQSMLDLPEPTRRSFDGFSWSPRENTLLVDQISEDAEDRWLYLVSAADRRPREIWHDRRATRIYQMVSSRWRGDGAGLLLVGDLDERHRLYSLSVAGGTPVPLTPNDWDVVADRGAASIQLAPGTGRLYFVSNRKNPYERQVYAMPEAGGPVTQVTALPGVHEPFLSPDERRLAVLRSDDIVPPELYLLDVAAPGTEQRVTRSPLAAFDHQPWVQPRYVTFKSRIDGFTLHGRLFEPPNLDRTKKHPVVFGPVYSNTVRRRWGGLNGMLQQLLAIEGQYLVFQVDVRGSTGYGREFREKFLMDWGGGDIEDLHSGVEYLATLPYVDRDRIGIWGSSYGGTLTIHALFKKPGLFKAGVAGAPAVSAAHFGTDDVAITRLPSEHPDVFRRGTVIDSGQSLRDHLLIIHGMQDDVVPFKTTVMLAEKLMQLGKDFDVAFAPMAAHGWSQREHYAVFLLRKLVQHFDRHLGRGPLEPAVRSSREPWER